MTPQVGGRLQLFLKQWKSLTSDSFVLECVQGYRIPFARTIVQFSEPIVKFNSQQEQNDCEDAINKLLSKGDIRSCNPCPNQFLSSFFVVPKSDGSNRFILNLKKLNSFIDIQHFKLENIRTAMNLISKNCFLAVLD